MALFRVSKAGVSVSNINAVADHFTLPYTVTCNVGDIIVANYTGSSVSPITGGTLIDTSEISGQMWLLIKADSTSVVIGGSGSVAGRCAIIN